MKKIIITIMGLFMIVLLSNSAYAVETFTSTDPGDTVEVDDAGNGPGFNFKPSPGSLMSINSDETVFTIVSTSAKTEAGVGMVYSLISVDSTIYQGLQTVDGSLAEFSIPSAGSAPTNLTPR